MNGRRSKSGWRAFLISLAVSVTIGVGFVASGLVLQRSTGVDDETAARLTALENEVRQQGATLRRAREALADLRQDLEIAQESLRTLPAVDRALGLSSIADADARDVLQDPVFGDREAGADEFGEEAYRAGDIAVSRAAPCRRVAGDVICGLRIMNTAEEAVTLSIDGAGGSAVATPFRFYDGVQISATPGGAYGDAADVEAPPGQVVTARVRFGPAGSRLQSVAQISLRLNGERVDINSAVLEAADQ